MAQAPKYKKAYVKQLPGMFVNGESVEEVCQALGVSRRAFYDWVERYPDFAAAYEEGKEASQAWWLKLGRAGAAGKVNVQPSLWIFNMKNRLGWRDSPDPEEITITDKKKTITITRAVRGDS